MSASRPRKRLVVEANERLVLPVPEFALSNRDEIIDRLMRDDDLRQFIESVADEGTPVGEIERRARRYADEIGPKFSAWFYFRFAYLVARWWIRLHYLVRVVSVDEQLESAIPDDATVILVSNHRSNFDPLIITYLASRRSTIALSAGEWARLWPLHHFVRAAGGFVVDRDADDPLYHRVLATYIRLAAASGLHQAFFPEGELSRDGTMSPPKLGFLNYYCRALNEGRDIVFVPVGLNYDRIPEDRRLARAEGSFENPKASFIIGSSLRYLASVATFPFRRRSHRCGNVCIAYGAPVSLRSWLRHQGIGTDELRQPARLEWLPRLAEELTTACAAQIPAPPVALVAAALCDRPVGTVWTVGELEEHVRELAVRLERGDAHVWMPGGVNDTVEFALDLLSHTKLVRQEAGGNMRIEELELPVLRHYANTIGHHGA